ncbi:MAG: hypothetical protein H0X66_14315 [Verrucomicrobia bacterium]|nr:hypothetical protein [Verrucomicrobiota bacterium]
MNPAKKSFQHAELFITENGQILAHNITPEMAAVLSALNPGDERMLERAKSRSGILPDHSHSTAKQTNRQDACSTLNETPS